MQGFLHFSKKYSKYECFCDGGNILTASDFDILSVSLLRTIFFEYSKCESVAIDETSMRVVVYIWICIIYMYNHSLPEICNALVLLALSSKVMTTETWEVIGGAISGGLLVRHGKALGPDRWRVKRWNCEVNMPWNFPESKWWSSLWAFGDFQGSGLRWYRFGDAMWLRCVFEIIWGFTVQNKPVLLLH